MSKRISPSLLSEGRDIMNELIKFNCSYVHQGEDIEQFCEVLFCGKSSSDRNDILRWAANQLLPDLPDAVDQKQMMEAMGKKYSNHLNTKHLKTGEYGYSDGKVT